MKKYVCDVCGYVYDPAKGDPIGGIAKGVSFEDLPDDWVCPICGSGKTRSHRNNSPPVASERRTTGWIQKQHSMRLYSGGKSDHPEKLCHLQISFCSAFSA